MIVLGISKKAIRRVLLAAAAFCLIFAGACYLLREKDVGAYTAYIEGLNCSKAEIFDIVEEKVIKTSVVNLEIRKEIEGYIRNITGIYPKVSAIPKEGYIIRVPLEPPLKVQGKWLKDSGKEALEQIFIFLPRQGKPYLMILDSQSRPLLFNFSGSIRKLLEQLEFYPEIIG